MPARNPNSPRSSRAQSNAGEHAMYSSNPTPGSVGDSGIGTGRDPGSAGSGHNRLICCLVSSAIRSMISPARIDRAL